jgi:trehalose 6-phosphate phosphatase
LKGSSNREIARALEVFFGAFEGAGQPLLLLDFDGTLAPIRVDRYKVRPWAGVRELLSEIQKQGTTRMVVITGRPAVEIGPLLGVKPMPEVWGLHGAERQLVDGRRELAQAPPAARTTLEGVQARLRSDALGGLFEEKDNAAVMHWRGVPAKKAKEVERRTRELFEPLAREYGLTLLEFEAGLELRTGPQKGDAVRALLRESKIDGMNGRAPHPAAYLGDDLTDESAFHAIKGHGISILVRREKRESAADVWLRPPEELRQFLDRWLKASAGLAAA